MTYLSLFSGIGGFDLGLDRAGHTCVGQVECDPAALKVLGRRWPAAPQFTDVRNLHAGDIVVRPRLICGGFPCQDLSVAGRRAGLAGERSGLFFEFMRIVGEFAPAWVLIENVPGLLSSDKGRDMGTVVGRLGDMGYGWTYRVLDAQWFGLAQQRRRVFIVGCAGADVRRAAEVLFERTCLPWDSPPSRQAGARVAASLTSGSATGSGVNKPGRRQEDDTNIVTQAYQCHGSNVGPFGVLRAGNGNEAGGVPFIPVAHALTAEGHDASEDGTPIVPVHASGCGNSNNLGIGKAGDPMHTLDSTGSASVAFQERGREGGRNLEWRDDDKAYSLNNPGKGGRTQENCIARGGVRRLTPKECCRLQGFPDDWLDGLGLSDSAKYRLLGNAVAVPVAEWIGGRLPS